MNFPALIRSFRDRLIRLFRVQVRWVVVCAFGTPAQVVREAFVFGFPLSFGFGVRFGPFANRETAENFVLHWYARRG